MDHADDIEGQEHRQGVGQDIDCPGHHAEQNLRDEQGKSSIKIEHCHFLALVFHIFKLRSPTLSLHRSAASSAS